VIDYIPGAARSRIEMLAEGDKWIPSSPLEVFGVTDPELVEFVTPRLTLQPWKTFYEPVRARPFNPDTRLAYVFCSGWQPTPFAYFYEKFKSDSRVKTVVMNTGHHCMLTEPLKTIEILASLA
jgi:hypothetical protein